MIVQTELRVIDLGKRGGKVVRRFPVRSCPEYLYHLSPVIGAFSVGVISYTEAYKRMLSMGYTPTFSIFLLDSIERG